jgi:tetratricopeptide (TPR) repeat protein
MATSARIEELKEKFDENPRRYFAPLANELRKQGDLAQAISICRTHLPNQPGHLSGHIVLAQALYEATDFEESRAEFQAALAIDPENLIALRFMGDLSIASGDVESARAWYQRVLDAEPRNYEIARIMRELNAPPNEDAGAQDHESQTAHSTPVVSRAVASEPNTLSFAPQIPQEQAFDRSHELPAERPPETSPVSDVAPPQSSADRDEGRDVPLVIDLPTDAHAAPVTEEMRPPAGSLDTHWDAEAVSASELSDFEAAPEDWFTDPVDPAEGLADDYEEDEEYTEAAPDVAHAGADHDIESLFATQGVQPSGTHAQAEVDTSTESPTTEAHADIPAIDFEEVEEAFGLQPQVLPATPSYDSATPSDNPAAATGERETPDDVVAGQNDLAAPQGDSVERASAHAEDLDIAADDDSTTRTAAAPELVADQPSTDAVAPVPETEWWEPSAPTPLIEPESTEPAHEAFGQMPLSNNADHIEPSIPAPTDTRIGRTPEYVETVPESTAAPFVTETLAELYLQQGFREEALSIYRQLLQRNPSDDTLRNRVAAIESGSGSYALDAAAQAHGQHHQVSSAQSVRAFFGRLAKRPPRRRASASGSGPLRRTGEFAAQSGPKDVERGRTRQGVVPNEILEPQSVDGASASREGSSSLTRLFNAPALSREDQDAAEALATAFNSPAANAGRPSRVADQELSLDHLFRDPASSDAAPVSLDDFYSAPRSGTSNSSPTESEPPDERAADIRQFTSWLEGLKKK